MNNKALLSAIILTKNEEQNIVNCIENISYLVSEIIIIDDYSTDRTTEIIENLKNPIIKVYKNHLRDDFSSQRNFGLSHAKTPWVLFIDSDEFLDKGLGEEITHVLLNNNEDIDGYTISRIDRIWGKKILHGETGHTRLIRLGRVGKGKWIGRVHEVWDIKGKIGMFRHPIEHFPHSTVENFLSDINYYTSLRAHELYENKTKTNFMQILLFPIGKFVLNYLVYKGYKDKIPGFLYAMLMSFHSFLVRGKLWFLWKKHEQ